MIVLFTGPTLPPDQVPTGSDLQVLPPVAHGDVYRIARARPWGIGIVDGYFEHVPAVWHKEILWAMSQGIHVFGASSMGALRAAELADFGMVGVGRVFEQFRDGKLVGDDEVALTHLSEAHSYQCTSEALVDMRATLDAATDEGICDRALSERLVAIIKEQFYPDRTWQAVLAAARATQADPNVLDALERWLPAGRVDQKRRDALAMIAAMRAAYVARPSALEVNFTFQHTDFWERAVHRMGDAGVDLGAGQDASALLDELRLLGDEELYTIAVQGALLRGVAEDTAERRGLKIEPDLALRTAVEFRQNRSLYTEPDTMTWLTDQGLDPDSFWQMMTREAKLRWLQAVSAPEVRRHLLDQLRAMGYGRLQSRCRAKRAALERCSLSVADLRVPEDEDVLWGWYFMERLGKPVPDDLAAYAKRLGFPNKAALFRAALVEHWYAAASEQ